MQLPSDWIDLISVFARCEVKYLVIGGYAFVHHSEPRSTKDLDFWIEASLENAAKVYRALAEFGAPLAGRKPEEFAEPDLIFQIGVPPLRVDILTRITGLTFAEAWPNRVAGTFGGQPVFYISKADLIKNKRTVGRLRDLADAEDLENTP